MSEAAGAPEAVFVANVGNRDVCLNIGDVATPWYASFDKNGGAEEVRKFLGLKEEGTRAIARHVLDNINSYRDRLLFPLMQPALRLALARTPRVARVLLLGTDQPEHARGHHLWDTIWSAHVLADWVRHTFAGEVATCIPIGVKEVDPSRAEMAHQFVGNVLREHAPPQAGVHVFASIKGGIPQMNAGLREQAFALYGPNALLIEVDEPDPLLRREGQMGNARMVSTWPLRRENVLRLVRGFLDRQDYEAAQALLAAEKVSDADMVAMLRHGQARLNLDFTSAAESLKHFHGGTPYQWRTSAEKAWTLQRLVDVHAAACLCLQRGDFVGFLARATTFSENCYRQIVFLLTRLQVDQPLHPRTISDRPLRDSLLADSSLLSLGGGQWLPNRPLCNAIVRYWERAHEDQTEAMELVNEIRSLIGRLKKVDDLRQDALHRMTGVSRDDIDAALPNAETTFAQVGEQIISTMQRLARTLGGDSYFVPAIFDDLKTEILDRLEHYEPPERAHD